jgi:hypothetical protein
MFDAVCREVAMAFKLKVRASRAVGQVKAST